MSKTYKNQLINEKSPYLLQHAHNPVNWYPWGEKPFKIAREKNMPLLVSIGYATCHWCHVMERESFEDPDLAKLLNDHFISIKIDREERPDIDSIYMQAVQAMGQQGGWPLNVFVTPEGVPFYTGKSIKDGKATAYICKFGTCLAPVNTPEDLINLLKYEEN